MHHPTIVNPRRACAARVTVVGFVCLCVCVSVKSHLTHRASVCPENAVTYSAGNEGQKICGDFPEITAFKSYAAKQANIANDSDLPAVSFLRLTHSEAPEIVNNIQPCPKRCLLMPLARVGTRTDTDNTIRSVNRGAWPIFVHVHWHSTQDTQYALRVLYFSAFH